MITARWLGLDVSDYVSSVPDVSVMAEASIADKVASVTLVNRNGIFDETGTYSILSGVSWRGTRFEATQGSDKAVSGVVSDGVSQNGMIELSIQSDFASAFSGTCDLIQYQVDPASAILALLRSGGIPDSMIDVASFERVSAEMLYRGVLINAVASAQYQTPLIDAINALAELGSMRIWMDTKIHVALIPALPASITYLQTIKSGDILGQIEYGALTDRETAYSVGYLGDSSGKLPATGGEESASSKVWSQAYNASSQWQLINEQAAHGAGQIRIEQMQRRRTAKIQVRDNGAIPIIMFGVYRITPWDTVGALVGYQKRTGVTTLMFEEVV